MKKRAGIILSVAATAGAVACTPPAELPRAFLSLGGIIAMVLAICVAAGVLEYRCWLHRIAVLVRPLMRFSRLPEPCALAFVASFASGNVAALMLADSRKEGAIDRREMILGALCNSVPSAFMFTCYLALPVIGILGRAGVLYFAVSFDLPSLYVQAVKLFADLRVPFKAFPWQVTGVIVWLIFNKWRKKIAVSRLRHFEARNCGFINELPIVSLSCGSMGMRKTTFITDMALSQEVMFRQKAFEILRENDMKFPYFPWICFEKELQKCMEYHTVYNLASVKEWARKKRARYIKNGGATGQLYGYDEKRYGTIYRDGLKESDIFNVLETYAQAYFIYVIESSLIVSNYAIRTDNEKIDLGNFPLWQTDFFLGVNRAERHSHILDFDILRLGRKVLENNPKAGSFEFGVVAITEIGKERGNNLELKEIKKIAEETNQKNDLFNSWLKMSRHSATVDNFPFIKVFADEQRPESWGADSRDLAEVLTILSAGEQRISLPFYTIEEMICEQAYCKFLRVYEDFRFRRGDNTLLVHILKTVTAKLWRRNEKIRNLYGYSTLALAKQRGTLDGKAQKKKYFLCNRKIYARRYSQGRS